MSSETDPHFEAVPNLQPGGETIESSPINPTATHHVGKNRFYLGVLILIVLGFATYSLNNKYRQYVHAESISALEAAGLTIHDDGRMLTITDPTRKCVTDDCMAHLGALNGRVRVDFSNCRQITDAGLVHLQGNDCICALRLGRTGVTDVGMQHLCSMSSLEALDLSFTGVSDVGLAHFSTSDLDKLQDLNLGATKITDQGLEHLGEMDGLRIVILEGTKVTGSGTKKLKATLPEVIVFGVK